MVGVGFPPTRETLERLAEARSPRRASQIIVALTFTVTVFGGLLIWLVDHDEFPNLGTSLWWSLQTVTTVGTAADPQGTWAEAIGAVMLRGIGFITVVAAAVTASLIEQARGRREEPEDRYLRPSWIESRPGSPQSSAAFRGPSNPALLHGRPYPTGMSRSAMM